MNWTNAADMFFLLGALLATGFVAYGGWLFSTTPAVDLHQAPTDGGRNGAKPEAKPFLALLRAAARREHIASILLACYAAGSIIGIVAPGGVALATEPFERGVATFDNFDYQAAMARFRLATGRAAARAQEILGLV